MSDNCPVCGLPTGAGSGGDDALVNHVNDYNDPHRTMNLVPRTYYGVGAPVVTDGYKDGDWYVDTSARVIYSCAVENTPSGQVLSWVPASTATAVTAADLASALSGYVLSTALASTLAGYVTSASAANFVTQTDLSGRGYATQTWVASALSGYATESWVSGLGFVNASALASELASYVTGTALATALGGYYGKTASDARYALKAETASFLEAADVAALLAQGFVRRAATSPGVYPELDLDTVLAAYLTSSAAATAYLAKADAASTYATKSELATGLAGRLRPSDLSSAMAPYLPISTAASTYLSKTDAASTYVASASLVSILGDYVDSDGLSSALSGYLTSSAAAATYLSKADALAGYVTSTALASALASYVTGSSLTASLGGYYDKAASDAKYALKSELAPFLDAGGVGDMLAAGYVRRTQTSPGVYPELNLDAVLASYLTSSAAAATYLSQSAASSTYATKSDLATGLAGRLRPSDLASAMAPYLLASTAASTYLSKTEAASTYLTGATLAPFIEDFITADDLPDGLDDCASKTWVSATYATIAALNNCVTSAALSAALANYVSATALEGALASYKTAAQCDAAYVTPAYLAVNRYLVEGAGYFSGFVTRSAAGSRDLDDILGAWPVSSLTAGETKPPQAGAVKAAIDAESTARSALAETVAGLVVTGGANALKDISETVSVTVSGVSTDLLKLYDSATNYIATTSDLVVDNKLRVSLPASPGTGIARDFLFCVAFSHATSVGQVPHVVDIIRNHDGTVPQFVSYMNLPFDLTGITYGTTVVWGFTEITSGKFAVTRKVLYSVGGGAGA